jgi:ribonuclease R
MSKNQKNSLIDPHAEREAEKYPQPIASRELIMQYLAECGGPRNRKEIAEAMEIHQPHEQEALRRRLKAMERDGQIVRNRRKAYGLVEKMDLIVGRVIGHPDGFGFLTPDDSGEDLFLSGREMRSLLHGDRAICQVVGIDRRGRREGRLVEVLERANHQVVGRYLLEGGIGIVVPDNKRIHQDILIPTAKSAGVKAGQIVVAEIVEQPDQHRQPLGRIVEVLGEHMAPGMEIDIAIRAHELPQHWPEAVRAEIAGIRPEVTEKDSAGRLDLRALPFVTIDGEDARDFDDAVYCEPTSEGWRLLVAIADVSHYVLPGAALDQEALNRGNSVYFPDRVIPMLPEVLSNGLCSLNPEVDRLSMVSELTIGTRGGVKEFRFHEAVIRSAARLTYNQVNDWVVEGKRPVKASHKTVLPHLQDLYTLFKLFLKRRLTRGAIDFDTTETRILFGKDRKIERIVPLIRNDAHRLIEEFMVAANVAAAQFLEQHEIPGLYRVHDRPEREKLEGLRTFLGELGLSLGGGDNPKSKDYAQLLIAVSGREDAHLIQTVLLRSLRFATYSPDNLGHFGLAFEAYTHFTSPIRRYPDLLVHRAIRHLLKHRSPEKFGYDKGQMIGLGEHCSMTERRADEATRDAVDWLKCEYMMDKVGDVFEGIITTVTSFGVFVELKDIYVEGLVHVTSMKNDYYHFDPAGHRLRGERSGKVYRLANKLKVKVMRVDLDERKIDFDLVE